MNVNYVITIDEVNEKGLKLQDYLIDPSTASLFINIALQKCITRILYYNDNFDYESDIETAIDNNSNLIAPFKKLQWQAIYNLVFKGDTDPMDNEVDDIICCDLRWGKINGFQKNVFVGR